MYKYYRLRCIAISGNFNNYCIQLDIRKEGDEIIDIICKTFGIWNLGELDLCKKQKVRIPNA